MIPMRSRSSRALALAVAAVFLIVACGKSTSTGAGGAISVGGQHFDGTVVIGLNTPFTTFMPIVGEFTERGAILAKEEINQSGGIVVGGKHYKIDYKKLDSELNVQRSVANTRQLIRTHGMVAVIEEGIGVSASNKYTNERHIVHWIDGAGSPSLVDTAKYPNVFRISPQDRFQGKLLTEYALSQGCSHPALLRDDTVYGTDGGQAIKDTLKAHGKTPVTEQTFTVGDINMESQSKAAQSNHADCILLWALTDMVAHTIKSIRDSAYLVGGKPVPVFSAPPAEDPAVRVLLKTHPEQVDGITFVSFKQNATDDKFAEFESKYEKRFGAFDCGCKDREGNEVRIPDDWDMHSYDMFYATKQAIEKAGTVDPSDGKILQALETVSLTSANGRQMSFSPTNHEGVGPNDIYLAVLGDMKYCPVKSKFPDIKPIDQVMSDVGTAKYAAPC